MNTIESVTFLTQAAWKGHGPLCPASGKPAATEARLCDCGAVEHNATVKEALMTIGGAAAAKRRK